MIYVLLKKGATPLKAVLCAFVAPFHILDAKVRQKVARGKKKCFKKSQRVNESTGQRVFLGGADGELKHRFYPLKSIITDFFIIRV